MFRNFVSLLRKYCIECPGNFITTATNGWLEFRFPSTLPKPCYDSVTVIWLILDWHRWLATGWTVRGPNPGGGEIFRTRPDRPWGPPSLLYNVYRVFPGGKAARPWRWPPTPSSAEVKERVELYLYSPFGPSWPVQWWTLPLPVFIFVPQQAEVAQGVPGRLRPPIFVTFGTTRVVDRRPHAPAAFTPEEIPGTHFQGLSRPQSTCFRRGDP